jgi:hypothetical protein
MKHATFCLMMFAQLAWATHDVDAGERAGVIVSGDASLQPQVLSLLETWLRDHGHEPVASPLPAEALASVIDCFVLEDERCARKVVEARASTSQVVITRLQVTSRKDGIRDVELTAYLFRKGADAVAERRFCEHCTEHDLRAATESLMSTLMSQRTEPTGFIAITSTPTSARVLIDDNPVGITPLEYELTPGTHAVSLVLDGREVVTRSVAIRAGETASLDVPLAPDTSQPGRSSRKLPAALIITGAAALATGIVMLAIDEDASPTAPYEIRNTGPTGAVIAGVGGAALAVGVVLWFRRGRTSHPVASLTGSGGAIGWMSRF